MPNKDHLPTPEEATKKRVRDLKRVVSSNYQGAPPVQTRSVDQIGIVARTTQEVRDTEFPILKDIDDQTDADVPTSVYNIDLSKPDAHHHRLLLDDDTGGIAAFTINLNNLPLNKSLTFLMEISTVFTGTPTVTFDPVVTGLPATFPNGATDFALLINAIDTPVDTVYQVLTSGSGAGSGGANVFLSNLQAPTSINEDLIPQAGKNLGLAGDEWARVHTNDLRIGTAGTITGTDNQIIADATNGMEIGVPAGDIVRLYVGGVAGLSLQSDRIDMNTFNSQIITGGLQLYDFTVPPIQNGEFRRVGADVFVYSGGVARNLSSAGEFFGPWTAPHDGGAQLLNNLGGINLVGDIGSIQADPFLITGFLSTATPPAFSVITNYNASGKDDLGATRNYSRMLQFVRDDANLALAGDVRFDVASSASAGALSAAFDIRGDINLISSLVAWDMAVAINQKFYFDGGTNDYMIGSGTDISTYINNLQVNSASDGLFTIYQSSAGTTEGGQLTLKGHSGGSWNDIQVDNNSGNLRFIINTNLAGIGDRTVQLINSGDANLNLAIPATAKFYLDGGGGIGNAYFSETSNNLIQVFTNDLSRMSWANTVVSCFVDFNMSNQNIDGINGIFGFGGAEIEVNDNFNLLNNDIDGINQLSGFSGADIDVDDPLNMKGNNINGVTKLVQNVIINNTVELDSIGVILDADATVTTQSRIDFRLDGNSRAQMNFDTGGDERLFFNGMYVDLNSNVLANVDIISQGVEDPIRITDTARIQALTGFIGFQTGSVAVTTMDDAANVGVMQLPYKVDDTSSPSDPTLDDWFGDQNGCAGIQRRTLAVPFTRLWVQASGTWFSVDLT